MKKNNATIKVDSEVNWNKAINYIPDQFTIIVYEYDNGNPPKIKMGDGVHKVSELPFLLSDKEVKDNTLIL